MELSHFLAINYTIELMGQAMQCNMVYPVLPDNYQADLDAFAERYPLAQIAYWTLSSVPATTSVTPYPLNRK